MTLLALLAAAALAAPDTGHRCAGGEEARYSFDAAHDTLCKSEQAHVCRCRRELHRIPDKSGNWVDTNQAYYDSTRDLCLDDFVHFQCLEKGGDWKCRAMGHCLCDNKPRRCVDKDLSPWKDFTCGGANCEDDRLLQGREPKGKANCRGGGRWRCVPSPACKAGPKECRDSDFGKWRAVGCGPVGGCPKGQMRMLRDKRTPLECDAARYQQCRPNPACKPQ